MTYCAGIKLKTGIVGIADTCITSGTTKSEAKKIYTYSNTSSTFFILSSGLRSVRDKAITYFEEEVMKDTFHLHKLYQVANEFGKIVKRVSAEDKSSLEENNYKFDSHALLGGQMKDDLNQELYMIFPEGNWIRVGESNTCYAVIGNGSFGKSILSSSLDPDGTIEYTKKVALLSFHQTVKNTNNVDYPLDLVVYEKNSYKLQLVRMDRNSMMQMAGTFESELKKIIGGLTIPSDPVYQQ
jgi:putative proteasome-type protease